VVQFKYLKYFIGLFLVLSFALCPCLSLAGAAPGYSAIFTVGCPSYTVDGQKHVMDAGPYIKDGRVFVPVRYLAYACGVAEESVIYENGTVYLIKGNTVIQLSINNKVMVVNGLSKSIDVAPELIQGRTYLPARFIAEALGYAVSWDPSAQRVLIVSLGDEKPEEPQRLSVSEVIEIAQPTVVLIQTNRSQGSGFFWSSDGEIVTNAHVVAGASEIEVTTYEGKTYHGRIEKLDAYLDIAIIRVDGDSFPYIPYYNTEVQRGEEVVVLGNPLGLRNSASKGIISAIRDIGEVEPDKSGITILQTDASVLPGNSGGPMLNMGGEVVGIIFAGVGEGLELNFALPIEYCLAVRAKPPFGVEDDFLLYLEQDKKWAELYNQFIELTEEVIAALENDNLAMAIQCQNLILGILDELRQEVGSYYPQTPEVEDLRTIYLDALRNYYTGNLKLLEALQFLGPWTITQSRMAFSEAERYIDVANRLLEEYNREKWDLYQQFISLD